MVKNLVYWILNFNLVFISTQVFLEGLEYINLSSVEFNAWQRPTLPRLKTKYHWRCKA